TVGGVRRPARALRGLGEHHRHHAEPDDAAVPQHLRRVAPAHPRAGGRDPPGGDPRRGPGDLGAAHRREHRRGAALHPRRRLRRRVGGEPPQARRARGQGARGDRVRARLPPRPGAPAPRAGRGRGRRVHRAPRPRHRGRRHHHDRRLRRGQPGRGDPAGAARAGHAAARPRDRVLAVAGHGEHRRDAGDQRRHGRAGQRSPARGHDRRGARRRADRPEDAARQPPARRLHRLPAALRPRGRAGVTAVGRHPARGPGPGGRGRRDALGRRRHAARLPVHGGQRARGRRGDRRDRGLVPRLTPSTPSTPRETPMSTTRTPDLDAIVIGAGFGGIYMLHKLRDELGLTVKAFEKGGGVGGTWYFNRYPGAKSDTEGFVYRYSFDRDLLQEWDWHTRYLDQPDVLAYLEHVVDRYDLARDIRLNTEVTGAAFDEDAALWTVSTAGGERLTCRYLVTALGLLAKTNIPDIPGLDDFAGTLVHTNEWPQDLDITGKRVGVI